jgi:hypothetical protein
MTPYTITEKRVAELATLFDIAAESMRRIIADPGMSPADAVAIVSETIENIRRAAK